MRVRGLTGRELTLGSFREFEGFLGEYGKVRCLDLCRLASCSHTYRGFREGPLVMSVPIMGLEKGRWS